MRKKSLITAIIMVFATIVAQTQPVFNFAGYENNPVLSHGEPGTWDSGLTMGANIVKDGDMYYLFYFAGGTTSALSIGLASSTDGYNFEKISITKPVFEADGTGFDAYSVFDPVVIKDGDDWIMFYGGRPTSGMGPGAAIGKAIASDPAGPWKAEEDPILKCGNPGEWDSHMIFPSSVIKTETGLFLYYVGGKEWPGNMRTGLAHFNGIEWIKYKKPSPFEPPFAESDPVLNLGKAGEWDDYDAYVGTVQKSTSGYEMFYTGSNDSEYGTGYATSKNGIDWIKKQSINPIFTYEDDPFAISHGYHIVEIPSIVIINDSYFVYYDYGTLPHGHIGLSTADALASIINVPEDQPTIQEAIDVATDGDTVLVAKGTYYENINFMGKAITVASQYLINPAEGQIENTIIDGSQPANPDLGSVVTFNSGEENTSILCGFTITGGTGYYIPPGGGWPAIRAGGGISVNLAGPKIISNHIHNNTAIIKDGMSDGAGISCGPPGTSFFLWLEDNIIENNHSASDINAGAAGVSVFGPGLIRNNTIANNLCESDASQCGPGGLGCYYGDVTVVNNTITGNKAYSHQTTPTLLGGIGGGAIFFMSTGKAINNTIKNNRVKAVPGDTCFAAGVLVEMCATDFQLESNMITNNGFTGDFCYGGGMAIWYGGATLVNDVFYENTATYGGGICIFDTSAVVGKVNIVNNTIANNFATKGGNALFSHRTNVVIKNTVFWNSDNPPTEEIMNYGGDLTITYSIAPAEWTGTGNMHANPRLAATGDHPCCLCPGSPCVDAGMPDDWYLIPLRDITGKARTLDGNGDGKAITDMGAYEIKPHTIPITPPPNNHNSTLGVKCFPNPFSKSTTVQFILYKEGFVNLGICDATGKNILTLHSGLLQDGAHSYVWNAEGMPEGMYLLRLEADGKSESMKLLLLK